MPRWSPLLLPPHRLQLPLSLVLLFVSAEELLPVRHDSGCCYRQENLPLVPLSFVFLQLSKCPHLRTSVLHVNFTLTLLSQKSPLRRLTKLICI